MGRAHGVNKNSTNGTPDTAWINKPSRGIGDTVEKIIHKVSGGKVKSCGGCKERRNKLNNLLPYKPCLNCREEKKEDPPPTT